MAWRCGRCASLHEDSAMAFHARAPAVWDDQFEASGRGELSTDQCVIDDQHFFVRGLIQIPVSELDEPFGWGVWVSLSGPSFLRTNELWKVEGREREPPMFGWLSTELSPHYPSTLNLPTSVHTRPVGLRPLVTLEPTDHPLAVEQRQGITRQRLEDLWRACSTRNSLILPAPPGSRCRTGILRGFVTTPRGPAFATVEGDEPPQAT